MPTATSSGDSSSSPVAGSWCSVSGVEDGPAAPVLRSERLLLEPLKVGHAEEMAPLLADPGLYAFTGASPVTLDELRRRYERQVRGHSEDGHQRWLNWIVRLEQTGAPVGAVQATMTAHSDGLAADLAWLIAVPHQRRGYATEAATVLARWLREQGAQVLAANIHPRHEASMDVARALGMTPTDEVIDGEIRWATAPTQSRHGASFGAESRSCRKP
jgi:RimJ/RimL family protein N-acetyltransferase